MTAGNARTLPPARVAQGTSSPRPVPAGVDMRGGFGGPGKQARQGAGQGPSGEGRNLPEGQAGGAGYGPGSGGPLLGGPGNGPRGVGPILALP